jgi:hypothetical protein
VRSVVHRSVRLVGSAVVFVGVVTVLGGCGAGAPRVDVSPMVSMSAATRVAAPERPKAAAGLTGEAAAQFVRYYSELMNYAADTGDTAALMAASEAGCGNCKAYVDFIAKSNAANGLLTGDYHEHITGLPELTLGKPGFAGGSATLIVGAYVSKADKKAAALSTKPAKYSREFALSAKGGDWVMYEMKQTEK